MLLLHLSSSLFLSLPVMLSFYHLHKHLPGRLYAQRIDEHPNNSLPASSSSPSPFHNCTSKYYHCVSDPVGSIRTLYPEVSSCLHSLVITFCNVCVSSPIVPVVTDFSSTTQQNWSSSWFSHPEHGDIKYSSLTPNPHIYSRTVSPLGSISPREENDKEIGLLKEFVCSSAAAVESVKVWRVKKLQHPKTLPLATIYHISPDPTSNAFTIHWSKDLRGPC